MEMLCILGCCDLFLGNQLLDSRLWGSHTSTQLADIGSSRECHGRSDVRDIRERFVCYRDPPRSARRTVLSAIAAPINRQRLAAGGVYGSMIISILFPVDFSPACVAMAAYVKRVASIFGSRVTLLYVCDLASHNGFELAVRSLQEIADEHWIVAQSKIDLFLDSEFPASKCPRMLRSGEAAEQIANVANTGGFDLIVMPTHAGRFRRMLLGSTTAKVLNDADCPVLTTEHAEVIGPRPLEHREWVCAIGLNGDSKRVLDLANRAATAAGARLSLIHVIQNSGSGTNRDSAEIEEARQRIGRLQKSVGCEAMLRVVRGPVKDALLELERQSAADVLIIGRPQSKVLGRMRDFTYGLVRDSPFPVLSL